MAGALGILVLAGCGSDSVSGPKQVPLTVKAMGTGAQASPARLASGLTFHSAYSAAAESIPVTFTKALLVVRDVRFHFEDGDLDTLGDDGDMDSTGSQGDSIGEGEDDDHEGGMVIFRGPFVLDLLSQSAESLGTQLVPPGDYDRVQGHLRALRASDWNAGGYPFLVGATVYLEGLVQGDGGGPFTYQTRIDNEFMIRGRFRVDAGSPATAFITFDVSSWLVKDGAFLDPRVPDNAKWIEWAIRHAIKVDMDDDHDGQPGDD
ncbi:MAG TPA: hypothetical protein VFX78_13140 [Candidatus Eisenbacteria bacterium]|jgi:hypothetical protein|nr:hypothetical protein [Candidatus Eisenbacteria bacterium]